ncbi:MAG TPA: GreA/GreB family elongation factor [Kofleriaceae bacterium]
MSKAFTQDDDGAPVAPPAARGLPVPEPNFVTEAGMRAARAELEKLVSAGERGDRARELTAHLETALVAPAPPDREAVGFGATVELEDEHGKRSTYRLVGAIEADVKRGALSWQSPLANALWNTRAGDAIELPRGGEATVIAIRYDG